MLHAPERVMPSIAVGAIVKWSGGMTSTQHLYQMNFKKVIIAAGLIAAAGIMTGCDSRPTLDRSVVEGYNNCIAAKKKAEGELAAANARAKAEATANGDIYLNERLPMFGDCKSNYGIPSYREISSYRITN